MHKASMLLGTWLLGTLFCSTVEAGAQQEVSRASKLLCGQPMRVGSPELDACVATCGKWVVEFPPLVLAWQARQIELAKTFGAVYEACGEPDDDEVCDYLASGEWDNLFDERAAAVDQAIAEMRQSDIPKGKPQALIGASLALMQKNNEMLKAMEKPAIHAVYERHDSGLLTKLNRATAGYSREVNALMPRVTAVCREMASVTARIQRLIAQAR